MQKSRMLSAAIAVGFWALHIEISGDMRYNIKNEFA